MKIDISIGKSRKDKVWKFQEMNLEEFIKLISSTARTSETMEQYRNLPKEKQDEIKDVGGFVLGKLKDNRRKKDCVISRSGLTLDMDYATVGIIDEIKMFFPFTSYFYSTHKHTKEKPRLRLIIPLSRNISPKEYCAVSRMIAKEIGIDLFDDTTYEASRLMYWPSTSIDGEFIFKEIKGDLLNPDDVLNKYKDWTDSRQWPVSSRQNIITKHDVKKQADPLEKEGLVGAFCRAYSIEDVVENFLPHIYEKSEMEGRYNYIPATSCAGVVVYDNKFAYSHHATDPACDKLVNAFDMVRIHKFGHLDENVEGNEECVNLPSYKSMEEFSVNDEKIRLQLSKERKELASMEFDVVEDEEENKDWQELLELDKHGKVKSTLSNIATIIQYDPNLKNIVYNELKSSIDVVGKLPWKESKSGWFDGDLACAKLYFEKIYGIWSPAKFKDALLAVIFSKRNYHPIKEYFSKLTWDGIERIDTLLVDYLGADDTEYVREVTRKTLCAAVARIYEPGIKFDSILVLCGPQGIGKSTLFSILGKDWYSDSLSITDMKDKTAAEKLQGYWILELGELAGMKKVDLETIKSFITRTDDKFRQAYGVTVENHPRSNIIVGTTNAESGFLRDIRGNRRFWPVDVSGGGKYKSWDLKETDQIWAEAIVKYKEGEILFLKGKAAIEASIAQQGAMEGDDREGVVIDYLEKLLPSNWDEMDLYQRRSFLSGDELSQDLNRTIKRERVCTMEIWCECFYKERQNLRRIDSYEIEGIINRIGGWEKISTNKSGKTRYPLYGPQKTFVRKSS